MIRFSDSTKRNSSRQVLTLQSLPDSVNASWRSPGRFQEEQTPENTSGGLISATAAEEPNQTSPHRTEQSGTERNRGREHFHIGLLFVRLTRCLSETRPAGLLSFPVSAVLIYVTCPRATKQQSDKTLAKSRAFTRLRLGLKAGSFSFCLCLLAPERFPPGARSSNFGCLETLFIWC